MVLHQFWMECRRQIGEVQPGLREVCPQVLLDCQSDGSFIKRGMKGDKRNFACKIQKLKQCFARIVTRRLHLSPDAMNQNIVVCAGCRLLQYNFKCVVETDLTILYCHCANGNKLVPGWIKAAGLDIHNYVTGGCEGGVQICPGQGSPAL